MKKRAAAPKAPNRPKPSPSDYKIEKNIPLPKNSRRSSRFPFEQMVLGDSFVVPADEISAVRTAMKDVNRDLREAKKKVRFISRVLSDGTCRVWMVDQ